MRAIVGLNFRRACGLQGPTLINGGPVERQVSERDKKMVGLRVVILYTLMR